MELLRQLSVDEDLAETFIELRVADIACQLIDISHDPALTEAAVAVLAGLAGSDAVFGRADFHPRVRACILGSTLFSTDPDVLIAVRHATLVFAVRPVADVLAARHVPGASGRRRRARACTGVARLAARR